MGEVSKNQQQAYWDKEHSQPSEITQLDAVDLSSGVRLFYEWLVERDVSLQTGIEMCCGKGRNVLGLAKLGIRMSGFDYSVPAIREAIVRSRALDIRDIDLKVHDATRHWPYSDNSFTIGLDCFATADLEDYIKRQFATIEMIRVLQPGGHLNVYTLSSDDEWSLTKLREDPLEEPNTYRTPEGKFEKCFSRDELLKLYSGMKLVEERRIEKLPKYNGRVYPAKHHWMIFQKP